MSGSRSKPPPAGGVRKGEKDRFSFSDFSRILQAFVANHAAKDNQVAADEMIEILEKWAGHMTISTLHRELAVVLDEILDAQKEQSEILFDGIRKVITPQVAEIAQAGVYYQLEDYAAILSVANKVVAAVSPAAAKVIDIIIQSIQISQRNKEIT